MRKIVQFQVIHGGPGAVQGEKLYALTEDGVLWRRTEADGAWQGIDPPGDADPFKAEMTDERLLRRLARGDGFPEEKK